MRASVPFRVSETFFLVFLLQICQNSLHVWLVWRIRLDVMGLHLFAATTGNTNEAQQNQCALIVIILNTFSSLFGRFFKTWLWCQNQQKLYVNLFSRFETVCYQSRKIIIIILLVKNIPFPFSWFSPLCSCWWWGRRTSCVESRIWKISAPLFSYYVLVVRYQNCQV